MGIYDLLLHKRDVSFSFETLLQWITSSGIHFIDFDSYKIRYNLRTRYVHFDLVLKKALTRLDPNNNVFIMEIFKGDVIRYDFYASRVRECLPNLHDVSNLMYLYGNPHGLRQAIS